MSTRGFITFVINDNEKTAYNHSDSYPIGLGLAVLTWLREAIQDISGLRNRVAALRLVSASTPPTAADIERLRPFTNLRVGERSASDWYCLLRETQGNPTAILEAGVIEDASDLPAHSDYAEWGYVVDLDANAFEVYRGNQGKAHNAGRFAHLLRDGCCYPVARVASWRLAELPTNNDFILTFRP